MQKIEPCYYSDYLQLDKILDAHSPMSTKYKGKVAHDENLFIIIHQTYELWFKQILIEVNSVRGFFNSSVVKDTDLHTMVSRLDRVVEILNILVDQIKIIETMTPMDFMDFRDFLLPASGFQSVQFRQIEIALGLKLEDRTSVEKGFFNSRLNDTDRKRLNDDGKKDSLFTLVQSWLERMPFSTFKTFNFWEEYKSAVAEMLESDLKIIQNNKTLTETQLKFEEANFKLTKSSFDTLFDEKLHNELL
ncbi:MAG: tryptophan 2,3-dioxygenase, partial [Thermoproteota archaeon]